MARPTESKSRESTKIPPTKTDAFKKPRKPRRRKRVKSEIRKLQKSTHLLNSRASFQREIRKTMAEINPEMRITSNALLAIQEAAETALTEAFTSANTIAVACAGRSGPLIKDFQVAVSLGHKHLTAKH